MNRYELWDQMIEIWKHEFENEGRMKIRKKRLPSLEVRMPATFDIPKRGSFLFVGLNPSFSAKITDKLREKSERGSDLTFDASKLQEEYDWSQSDSFDLDYAIDKDSFAKENAPYFSKFSQFVPYGVWDHLDTFFIRETKSGNLFRMIFDKKKDHDVLKLNDFAQKQFNLFWELVEQTCPVAIVVTNSTSGKIIRKQKEKEITFDEELDCDVIEISGRKVPIFYCGYMNYQDWGSLERLKCGVGKAFFKYPSENNTTGFYLAGMRLRKRLSYEEAADYSDLSREAYLLAEKGELSLTREQAELLSGFYGVSPELFLTNETLKK